LSNELIIYILFSFCFTFIGIKIFISVAPKLSLVDIPNNRSAHNKITPKGAGIIFGFIFLCSIFAFTFPIFDSIKYTLLAIIVVYVGGVFDDIYNLSSKKKFLFLIIASLIAYYSGFNITYIGNYFGIDISLGYLSIPFTVFAIVGFTNALNLSDGLDGLAGSISIVILSTLLILGFMNNDILLISWSSILISVITAFMFFNWNPAKVFMGDSGSLLIGFVVSLLGIRALEYVNAVAILFLVAVPILDTLIVLTRRIQRGESPFKADKTHLHHILLNIKRDKTLTVKLLFLMQLIFSGLFLQLNNQNDLINLSVFVLLFIIFFNLFEPRSRTREKRKLKNNNLQKSHAGKRKNKLALIK